MQNRKMKVVAILIFVISTLKLSSQDISGQWNGLLKIHETQLRVVFHISKNQSGYSSVMDSPDQGAKGILVTNTIFLNSKLKLGITNLKIEYNGEFKDSVIIGIFKQGDKEFPMNLSKQQIQKEVLKKPQEPLKPYSYHTEDITFINNKESISLAGTLSLPSKEGVFPAVVLISGSGSQNRDEEFLGHKPFLVISDCLTKNGIAVLRYDDRGVGQSEGDFKTATSADFATDVESAVAYLKTRKEIDKSKIGLIGHSEGGLIAPMVASKSKEIAFIILLAGPGIKGDKLLLLQEELIAKASGIPQSDINKKSELNSKVFEIVNNSNNDQDLKNNLTNFIEKNLESDTGLKIPSGITRKEFILMQVNQISSPWMQYFIKFDPVKTIEKVKCPVLAVNGEKDLQVSPKENLNAIKNALARGGNKNISIIEFPNLNHLFQECKTGLPAEYSAIEQTFSPMVLDEMIKWIIKQIK